MATTKPIIDSEVREKLEELGPDLLRAKLIAINFNDRDLLPVQSIWEEEMYAWVLLPADILHFPRGRSLPSAS
jgi:hypothetical protein